MSDFICNCAENHMADCICLISKRAPISKKEAINRTIKAEKERDSLKAELASAIEGENAQRGIREHVTREADHYKSLAEKMGEALEKVGRHDECRGDCTEIAEEALIAYHAEGGKDVV